MKELCCLTFLWKKKQCILIEKEVLLVSLTKSIQVSHYFKFFLIHKTLQVPPLFYYLRLCLKNIMRFFIYEYVPLNNFHFESQLDMKNFKFSLHEHFLIARRKKSSYKVFFCVRDQKITRNTTLKSLTVNPSYDILVLLYFLYFLHRTCFIPHYFLLAKT